MEGGRGSSWIGYVFFFQAEDGIRDLTVTGVQTCALPIILGVGRPVASDTGARIVGHVVDDGIHIDADAYRVTALHHGGEFGVRSRPATRDAVAHRLGALAPGVARGVGPVLLLRAKPGTPA